VGNWGSPGTCKNNYLPSVFAYFILQICHVIIYDDSDDGQDKTEDDDLDDDDDAMGQWPETRSGLGCPDDDKRAIYTQVWRALQVKKNFI